MRLLGQLGESWQSESGKNCQDGNNDYQLNQGEPLLFVLSTIPHH
jgi:hypothetical protein